MIAPIVVKNGSESASQPRTEARLCLRFFAFSSRGYFAARAPPAFAAAASAFAKSASVNP